MREIMNQKCHRSGDPAHITRQIFATTKPRQRMTGNMSAKATATTVRPSFMFGGYFHQSVPRRSQMAEGFSIGLISPGPEAPQVMQPNHGSLVGAKSGRSMREWFLVPAGLPPVGAIHCAGALLIIAIFSDGKDFQPYKHPALQVTKYAWKGCTRAAVALGVAYLVLVGWRMIGGAL